jgi:oxygen-dependent protoporphyrinogen oxidase
MFADRAPPDHVLLTTFVGGVRNPGLALASEATVARAVQEDLQHLLGVQGDPLFLRVRQWRYAIPQYELGYQRFERLIDEIEAGNPGFVLAGNYRDGLSVADAMTSGYAGAKRLVQRGKPFAVPETAAS